MEPITDNPVVARIVNYLSHSSMFAAILYAYVGVQPYLAKIDLNDERHNQMLEWQAKHNKRIHGEALAIEDAEVVLNALKEYLPDLDINKIELEIALNQIKRSIQ